MKIYFSGNLITIKLLYLNKVKMKSFHVHQTACADLEGQQNNTEESVLYYVRKYHNDFTLL